MTDANFLSAKEMTELATARKKDIEKETQEKLEREINSEIHGIYSLIQEKANIGQFELYLDAIYAKSRTILEKNGFYVHASHSTDDIKFILYGKYYNVRICWDPTCYHNYRTGVFKGTEGLITKNKY